MSGEFKDALLYELSLEVERLTKIWGHVDVFRLSRVATVANEVARGVYDCDGAHALAMAGLARELAAASPMLVGLARRVAAGEFCPIDGCADGSTPPVPALFAAEEDG